MSEKVLREYIGCFAFAFGSLAISSLIKGYVSEQVTDMCAYLSIACCVVLLYTSLLKRFTRPTEQGEEKR